MKTWMASTCILLLSVPAGFLPLAAAETPVQTLSFASASDGGFHNLLGSPIFVGANQELNGFTRFDPNLGTLTEVRFTVQVNARVSVTVSAQQVLDEQSPFTVLLDSGPTDLRQASLIYNPTGANFGRSVTYDNGQVNPVGGSGLNPFEWGSQGNLTYQETQEEVFGGFANGGETPSTGTLLASDPDVNLADFVGTGTVPGLQFALLCQFENVGLIDNVPEAFVEVSVDFSAGEATLQYIYTPVIAPVHPRLVGYSRGGNTHTLQFTGTAGRADWAVKGGSALGLFPSDHTAQATIAEIFAGTYEAVLQLPSLVDPIYYFRIE